MASVPSEPYDGREEEEELVEREDVGRARAWRKDACEKEEVKVECGKGPLGRSRRSPLLLENPLHVERIPEQTGRVDWVAVGKWWKGSRRTEGAGRKEERED
jgi:hypothetical protein